MQVTQLGDGPPNHVVVSLIHGDEPEGAAAVKSILEEEPPVTEPVEFIVANDRAAEAGERFIDEDLNRAFPGDPDADSHERRLAAKIWDRVQGKRVLDLHSTISTGLPLVEIVGVTEETTAMARETGASHAVDFGDLDYGEVAEGSMVGRLDTGIAVECGRMGERSARSQAAWIVRNFLANEGVLTADGQSSRPVLYRATDVVEKGPDWEFVAENFEPVFEGQTYAKTPDGPVRAEEPFYPVLMSTDGYEEILGFRTQRVRQLVG